MAGWSVSIHYAIQQEVRNLKWVHWQGRARMAGLTSAGVWITGNGVWGFYLVFS